jgi:hypothetical protein
MANPPALPPATAAVTQAGNIPTTGYALWFAGIAAAIKNLLSGSGTGGTVSVDSFGAVGDGSTDDTSAILAAIAALPSSGGDVIFTSGKTYKITQTLVIGNGTSSVQSTQQGIYLVGESQTTGQGLFEMVSLSWAGSAGGTMISFLGPMSGWGVKNIFINGNNLAAVGVKAAACSDGELSSCVLNACTLFGLQLYSIVTGGTGHHDSQYNRFDDLMIFLPNISGCYGMLLDGNGIDSTSNTSFNTISNCEVIIPSSSNSFVGYYLKACDSNLFYTCSAFGGGTSTSGVVFDYTAAGVTGGWPANNCFHNMDSSVNMNGGTSWLNVGSPGVGARPNRFHGISDTNSTIYPKIANTTYNAEMVNPGIDAINQVASIGTANITPIAIYVAGMYRISYYLEVTTTGVGGASVSATFGWTDDTGAGQTVVSATISTAAQQFAQGSIVIRSATGVNVTYATTVTGAIGAAQYALHVRLEKLD